MAGQGKRIKVLGVGAGSPRLKVYLRLDAQRQIPVA